MVELRPRETRKQKAAALRDIATRLRQWIEDYHRLNPYLGKQTMTYKDLQKLEDLAKQCDDEADKWLKPEKDP